MNLTAFNSNERSSLLGLPENAVPCQTAPVPVGQKKQRSVKVQAIEVISHSLPSCLTKRPKKKAARIHQPQKISPIGKRVLRPQSKSSSPLSSFIHIPHRWERDGKQQKRDGWREQIEQASGSHFDFADSDEEKMPTSSSISLESPYIRGYCSDGEEPCDSSSVRSTTPPNSPYTDFSDSEDEWELT